MGNLPAAMQVKQIFPNVYQPPIAYESSGNCGSVKCTILSTSCIINHNR